MIIAKNNKQKAFYFDANRGLVDEEFTAQQIPIADIQLSVDRDIDTKLLGSLWEEGLRDPCIIIANTPENWELAKRGVIKDRLINNRMIKPWLALTGNGRIILFRDTESIDCFIVQDFPMFHALQLVIQNGVINHEI